MAQTHSEPDFARSNVDAQHLPIDFHTVNVAHNVSTHQVTHRRAIVGTHAKTNAQSDVECSFPRPDDKQTVQVAHRH